MFAISSKGGGLCIGFPDVCLVPNVPSPIPTPFANLAQCRDAEDTSSNVLAENKEVLVESSVIPMSSGNEPGTAGGVISGVNRGPVRFKTASDKVRAGGKKVVIHTAVSAHNGHCANMPAGHHITPSQGKVFAGG